MSWMKLMKNVGFLSQRILKERTLLDVLLLVRALFYMLHFLIPFNLFTTHTCCGFLFVMICSYDNLLKFLGSNASLLVKMNVCHVKGIPECHFLGPDSRKFWQWSLVYEWLEGSGDLNKHTNSLRQQWCGKTYEGLEGSSDLERHEALERAVI